MCGHILFSSCSPIEDLHNKFKTERGFNYCEFPHFGQNLAARGMEDLQLKQIFFEFWFLSSDLIGMSTGLNFGSVS
jgi:hypothetical protein